MEVNEKDKNNEIVNVGDSFWAYIMRPTIYPPTLVTVVSDVSPENLDYGRDYDVEDEKGNRIWNAHMILKYGDRVCPGMSKQEYHKENLNKWFKGSPNAY